MNSLHGTRCVAMTDTDRYLVAWVTDDGHLEPLYKIAMRKEAAEKVAKGNDGVVLIRLSWDDMRTLGHNLIEQVRASNESDDPRER